MNVIKIEAYIQSPEEKDMTVNDLDTFTDALIELVESYDLEMYGSFIIENVDNDED